MTGLVILNEPTDDFDCWIPCETTPPTGPGLLLVDLNDKTAIENLLDWLDNQ